MREEKVALLAGTYSLAMILGALFFQYAVNVPPCEMCHWQRWPHDAAIFVGFGSFALFYAGVIDRPSMRLFAWVTLIAILTTACIGAWQAGVEWRWWPGPSSCTGPRFQLTQNLDLNAPVVSCDNPQWTLIGISLAGYNFLCSTTVVVLGALLMTGKIKLPFAWADQWANKPLVKA